VVWGFKWPAASTRRHRITVKLIDEALNLNETEIILCALRSFCAAKHPLSPGDGHDSNRDLLPGLELARL
jgi:hypothetical protein